MELNDHSNWLTGNFSPGLVSVIIPTFNREALLSEALESLVSQTYRPIECVVVDDGSSDFTREIVEKYVFNNTGNFTIKYFYQDNAGAQVARNRGTLESSGEFIQYLDSDDLLHPEKIRHQVDFLQANSGCDAVFGNWRTGEKETNEVVIAFAKEDMIEQMLMGRCIHTLSFLMRRNLVSRIGPWDIALKRNQEIDYHLRGLLQNAHYEYCNLDTGLHRTHAEARITTNTGLKEIMQFYEKWEILLRQHEKFNDEMKAKFANMYVYFFLKDVRKNAITIKLLTDVMRLNPHHAIFSSTKLRFIKKIIGTRPALEFWLSWFIYKNNQHLQSEA